MSDLPGTEVDVSVGAPSEEVARRAVLRALRSRTELTRPLFPHDCDDDPAIVFSEVAASEDGNDKPGLDDLFWATHRGWDL